MKNIWLIFSLSILLMSPTYATSCGKYLGKTITTYGKLSCSEAKEIYKAFTRGNTPKGWTCGQSVGGCGKGKMGFYFK